MSPRSKTNFFCTMEQVEPHLPDHLKGRSIEEWAKLSKDGGWAPIFRFGNGIYFRKASILKACVRLFGETHPFLIASMNEAGFVMPE